MNAPSSLESFLTEITRITGLELCLFDFNYFTRDAPELHLGSEQRIHACAYCRLVKSKSEAWRKCIETEYWRAEKAAEMDRPFLHTCHAGITDLIVPIRSGRKQIGALYLGQIIAHTRERQAKVMRKLAEKFDHALPELEQAAARQPQLHPEQLLRFGALLLAVRQHVEQAVELQELRSRQHAVVEALNQRANGDTPAPGSVPIYFLKAINAKSHQIMHALQLIQRGYWKNITQPTVAREVGLSTSRFSRLFHEETGMTFRSCLMRTRLEAAGYLLKRSPLTVTQVAERVGYQNNTSMQRAFRRLKGVTPKEFIHRQGEQEFCLQDEKELKRKQRRSRPEQPG
jgi:AraC-like DNA-binding protein/ligand-binding sensor protein